ncbi:MAG: DUF1801 domain-containing protein [Alishewanella sp.]|nr:DUF1801 domain-containing protein [Alishewanella sp.]
MAELKTKATHASVADYLSTRANDSQKTDCETLMAMFKKITGQPPKMWGPSIVGYGSYKYKYESGRTGEMCLTGFAIRGRELVVYLSCEDTTHASLLCKLGQHRMTKSCLYFKRLSDLDTTVLEQLVINSIEKINARYNENNNA